jgi:PPP family 3-phenylpropionic acid transporter
VLAPLNPIADALTLAAATVRRFEYGWVRGAGSAAFILGTVLSGFAIGRWGLPVFVWLNAAPLFAASLFALNLPRAPQPDPPRGRALGGTLSLLRLPWFVRLVLVAALVQGSHALHDSFAVIRWQAAGMARRPLGSCGQKPWLRRCWFSPGSANR